MRHRLLGPAERSEVVKQLHFVLPDAARDPNRPSGGNSYDVRASDGLAATGWQVIEHALPDSWPIPGAGVADRVARTLASIPSESIVLIDGLIASVSASACVQQSRRLAVVVLMHLPTWHEPEAEVLRAAAGVVTTSRWTRAELLTRYALPESAVHVAEPGVDPAAPATGNPAQLVNVAAVSAIKGQDTLLSALARLRDRPDWHCRLVGPLDREPAFTVQLRERAAESDIADRVSFIGPLLGNDLAAAYRASGLAVVASRTETFGLSITEALAHGLPVIGTDTGGVPEALGTTTLGAPAVLVRPDDDAALAAALRTWLDDDEFRGRLQAAARERRTTLPRWQRTVERIDGVLRVIEQGGQPCRN